MPYADLQVRAEYLKNWQNENREYCKELTRNWYHSLSHEDKQTKIKKANKNRADKINANVEEFFKRLLEGNKRPLLSIEILKDLWDQQKGLCAISKVPMTHIYGQGHVSTNVSIDRINPQKGYVKNNIQLTCFKVNIMKYTEDLPTLIWWCKQIIKGTK